MYRILFPQMFLYSPFEYEIKTAGYYVDDLSNCVFDNDKYIRNIYAFTLFNSSDVKIECQNNDIMFKNKKLHALIDFDKISNAKDNENKKEFFRERGLNVEDGSNYFVSEYIPSVSENKDFAESSYTIQHVLKVIESDPNYILLYKRLTVDYTLLAISNLEKCLRKIESQSLELNHVIEDVIVNSSMINPRFFTYFKSTEEFISLLKEINEITKNRKYNVNDILSKLRKFHQNKILQEVNRIGMTSKHFLKVNSRHL